MGATIANMEPGAFRVTVDPQGRAEILGDIDGLRRVRDALDYVIDQRVRGVDEGQLAITLIPRQPRRSAR